MAPISTFIKFDAEMRILSVNIEFDDMQDERGFPPRMEIQCAVKARAAELSESYLGRIHWTPVRLTQKLDGDTTTELLALITRAARLKIESAE